jgi:hypothetical protein
MVAVLDTWSKPQYLDRIWTIYEQYTAISKGIKVRMILPPDAAKSLIDEFEKGKEGVRCVKKALSSVDSASAIAAVKSDETNVKELIKRTLGFKTVNREITHFMIKWIGEEFKKHMNSSIMCKSPSGRSVSKRSEMWSCLRSVSNLSLMSGEVAQPFGPCPSTPISTRKRGASVLFQSMDPKEKTLQLQMLTSFIHASNKPLETNSQGLIDAPDDGLGSERCYNFSS